MKELLKAVEAANDIVIIQAENPDGDSLGSALALEQLLGEQGKTVHLYCRVDIPRYLRYLPGWDRVTAELPHKFDLSIIVDASTMAVLERIFSEGLDKQLSKAPCAIIDHHDTKPDLPLTTVNVIDGTAVSTGQIIYELAQTANWPVDQTSSQLIAATIMSDSLGLTSSKVTARSIHILARLVENGADLYELDSKRREFGKKPFDIFKYKGELFDRVQLHSSGRIATVVIPWEDIERYSEAYNPSMLIIDEMRSIEGVWVAAAFKTYPDGKITCKLRANSEAQWMDKIAEHFGGGGHPFAAGFKRKDSDLEPLMSEFINYTSQLIDKSDSTEG